MEQKIGDSASAGDALRHPDFPPAVAASSTDGDSPPPADIAASVPADAAAGDDARLAEYDDFVNNRLSVDLRAVLDSRVAAASEVAAFQELERSILNLKDQGQAALRTRVELGSGMYVQAVVPEPEKIYVNVGLGFHVECGLDDALRVARLRKECLTEKVERYDSRIGAIRAHARLMGEGIEGLRSAMVAGEAREGDEPKEEQGRGC